MFQYLGTHPSVVEAEHKELHMYAPVTNPQKAQNTIDDSLLLEDEEDGAGAGSKVCVPTRTYPWGPNPTLQLTLGSSLI